MFAESGTSCSISETCKVCGFFHSYLTRKLTLCMKESLVNCTYNKIIFNVILFMSRQISLLKLHFEQYFVSILIYFFINVDMFGDAWIDIIMVSMMFLLFMKTKSFFSRLVRSCFPQTACIANYYKVFLVLYRTTYFLRLE